MRKKDVTWTQLGDTTLNFHDVKVSQFEKKFIIIGYSENSSYYWKYSNDILAGSWIQILEEKGMINTKVNYLKLTVGSFLYIYDKTNNLYKEKNNKWFKVITYILKVMY